MHHQPHQASPVEKHRHQEEPLWRESLQSDGNLCTNISTGYEPKKFATVSRIEDYPGDPYQLYDVQAKFGEEDHRAPITEEGKELGEIGHTACRITQALIDYLSKTPFFQSHLHFDDSAESMADCDLEDGELQKMLTSPLYAQKASGNPMHWSCKESLRSHSCEGQKALGNPNALFSSEQGNLIRSSVFRRANPSNLIEGNKDHLLNQARSALAKQELRVESLKQCIGELRRQTEGQRLALQDA